MRFRRASKIHVSLDNIALTDIVLNLFIFFFITFSLFSTFQSKRETPLKVNLPSLSKGTPIKSVASYEIFLTQKGEILWNESVITTEALKNKLEDPAIKSKPVSLRADKDASVQALVSLLEVVRDSGAKNVALQTEIISK